MMRRNFIHHLLLILLITGCATFSTDTDFTARTKINLDMGYILVTMDSPQTLEIWLRNLDIKGGKTLKFKPSKLIQVMEMEPGDYAITKLTAVKKNIFGGRKDYYLELPRPLMRIIEIRPGEAVFIGNFKIESATLLKSGYFEYDYKFGEVEYLAQEMLQFSQGLKLANLFAE